MELVITKAEADARALKVETKDRNKLAISGDDKMPWKDPERWFSIPIIGAMLGLFWRGISVKKDQIDKSLKDYTTEANCLIRQQLTTVRIEKTLQFEINKLNKDLAREMTDLKDDIFEHMRKIELAILKQSGIKIDQ